MANKIIRKAFVNKRNKQLTITIPKRKLRAMDPKLKFNEDIFFELEMIPKRRKIKNGGKS